jgi:hypothetical protein
MLGVFYVFFFLYFLRRWRERMKYHPPCRAVAALYQIGQGFERLLVMDLVVAPLVMGFLFPEPWLCLKSLSASQPPLRRCLGD